MLIVSNFNPIIKKSGNNEVKVNNSKQVILQSKPDTVSFKANNEITKLFDKQVNSITKAFLKEYSDIFGVNFQEKFLDPWAGFLYQHESFLQYSTEPFRISTNLMHLSDYRVENGVAATLVDKKDRSIIYNTGKFIGFNEPITGVTINEAIVQLLKDLAEGKLVLNDGSDRFSPNPLKGVEIPKKLKNNAVRVSKLLADFRVGWELTRIDTEDLKVKRLQKALKTLMPEDDYT